MKLTKPIKIITGLTKKIIGTTIEILLIIPCLCICVISRYKKRHIDVGLGPFPIVNNIHHKSALRQAGFSAETFVNTTSFITDEFDMDLTKWQKSILLKWFIPYYLFYRVLFRYRALFIYFNGGPFMLKKYALHAMEPIFYKLAKIKIVVMPFGSDVQVLTRCKNLHFKHTINYDYSRFWKYYTLNRNNIDRWTRYADWVIGGGCSVDYLYHWDSLYINHLSIHTRHWMPTERKVNQQDLKLRILHAPNHPLIKGADALITATELLKSEGLDIELILLRGVPNEEIRKAMEHADLVADQFVIGWYGMFAIEAMAMGKPVLCYLREDLIDLYVKAGLLTDNEMPIINTGLLEIAEKIRWAYYNRQELSAFGKKGREFVQKHHSVERVGRNFSEILNELGIRNG